MINFVVEGADPSSMFGRVTSYSLIELLKMRKDNKSSGYILRVISKTNMIECGTVADYRYLKEMFPDIPTISEEVLSAIDADAQVIRIPNPWASHIARNLSISYLDKLVNPPLQKNDGH